MPRKRQISKTPLGTPHVIRRLKPADEDIIRHLAQFLSEWIPPDQPRLLRTLREHYTREFEIHFDLVNMARLAAAAGFRVWKVEFEDGSFDYLVGYWRNGRRHGLNLADPSSPKRVAVSPKYRQILYQRVKELGTTDVERIRDELLSHDNLLATEDEIRNALG